MPPIPKPPAAVTFDCWRTLLVEQDWERAHALRVEALRWAAREAGHDPTLEAATAAFDHGWSRHIEAWHEGRVTGAREVALDALAALGLHDPHPAIDHLVREYEEASHTSRVEAVAGAVPLLAALHARGIRLALVCDTGLTPGRVVRRHLERVGLLRFLDHCIFSDAVGVPKPDARMFRAALEPLGVPPERAAHVGDLLRTDVAGARALGMASIRFRGAYDDRSPLPEADAVVDAHKEILPLLGL